MPKYVFECQECQVRFERTLKMGDHISHPCPECTEEAPAVIEGFAFGFKEPSGSALANTGVHKNDYPTADQAVGKDSERRWETVHAREQVKAEARRQGQTDALIRHTSEQHIDYEPMSDVGRKAHYNLAKKAVAAVRKAREARAAR